MENEEDKKVVLSLTIGKLTAGAMWTEEEWKKTEDKLHALQKACDHMLATINRYMGLTEK